MHISLNPRQLCPIVYQILSLVGPPPHEPYIREICELSLKMINKQAAHMPYQISEFGSFFPEQKCN